VIVDYPEEKFGGFLAITDYRDPVIQKEIEANGWMIWPPIRYSYRTRITRSAAPRALAADLDASPEECARAATSKGAENRIAAAPHRKWNWLGTDDQGRDVVARLIYGFRISVLFGLTLTFAISSSSASRRRGAGLFRRLDDLVFQRFIEIWSSLPLSTC
jgi:microcin C transport system permease protein